MINSDEFIQKFIEKVSTIEFIKEEKELAIHIQKILSKSYFFGYDEVIMVKETVDALNSNENKQFEAESIYIHGNKSQVQFEYYDKIAKIEMGDLLFVSTLTYNSRPYIQKMTIVQAKKDNDTKSESWDIDKKQLFFLSNWPPFEGRIGMISKNKTYISDYSGCLGSYLLYRDSGDFSFITAEELNYGLRENHRFTLNDIYSIKSRQNSKYSQQILIFDNYRNFRVCGRNFFAGEPSIMQNSSCCINAFDFISQLAHFNIGELVFSADNSLQANEYAFRLLNTIIKYAHAKGPEKNLKLFSYNLELPTLDDFEINDLDIGIIHTIVEIGPIDSQE